MKTKDGNKTYDTLQVHTNGYWHEFRGEMEARQAGLHMKKPVIQKQNEGKQK